jgi:hypothetical protein
MIQLDLVLVVAELGVAHSGERALADVVHLAGLEQLGVPLGCVAKAHCLDLAALAGGSLRITSRAALGA